MIKIKASYWFDNKILIHAVNKGMTGKTTGGMVIIGATKEAWYGQLHEFGLGKFPPRPYMQPALTNSKKKFPMCFDGLLSTRIPALIKCALIVETEAKILLSSGGGEEKTPAPPGKPPHVQSGVLRASITHEVI